MTSERNGKGTGSRAPDRPEKRRRDRRRGRPGEFSPGGARARAALAGGRPLLRFVLAFLGVAAVLFGLYWAAESAGRFAAVNRGNATLCSGVLRLFGIHSHRTNTQLTFRGGGMDIISECSAVYVLILFAAGVMAFPAAWRARLRGLALGIPILMTLNTLRLVTLGLVLEYRAALLPLFHEYLWQVFFILVTAYVYLQWIERLVRREGSGSTA